MICVFTSLFSKSPRLYIVDGQHRYLAATSLGIHFRYEIRNVSTQEELITIMADLNNNSKGWFLQDYLAPWSSLGLSNYRNLSEIFIKTNLPLASLIVLFSSNTFGHETGGSSTEKFKRGAFVMKNKTLATSIIEEVLEIQRTIGKLKHPFILAFADFYVTKGKSYSRAKMVTALKRNKAAVKLLTRTLDIKEILKRIY